MANRSRWVTAMVVAITACSSGSSKPSPAPEPPAPTGTLVVRDGSGATGPFRLADLQRLFIDSTYAGPAGPHDLRVDVLDPKGNTFGSLRQELTAGADGSAAASQRLEVRGTPIHLYHLVGGWRFILVVDGTPLASAAVDVSD
jgi:hypothetical protein